MRQQKVVQADQYSRATPSRASSIHRQRPGYARKQDDVLQREAVNPIRNDASLPISVPHVFRESRFSHNFSQVQLHGLVQPSSNAIQKKGGVVSYGVSISSPSGGELLPDPTRAKMENALGVDFSDVRIYTDGQAEKLGAHAFTSGNHVHFARGEYDPTSREGQTILGHELVHVIQQREGRVNAAASSSGATVVQDLALEAEADALSAKAASSLDMDAHATNTSQQRAGLGQALQQKPLVQTIHPALVAIGTWLAKESTVNAATTVAAILGSGAVAASAGAAIMPGQTGVQEIQLENGWMSNTDKQKFELITQYRLINAYVDHWIRAHGGTEPEPAAAPTPTTAPASTGAATRAPTPSSEAASSAIDSALLSSVSTAVKLGLEEELNQNQRRYPTPQEFIWSDSGDHTADFWGTVGAIEFVDMKGTYLIEALFLKGAAAGIPNLNPPMQYEVMHIEQFRGGRMTRSATMETGLNDDLGINLVGSGPTIDYAANDGHGVHTYDTAWNWDDNTTHWAFDVYTILGMPFVRAQDSRGEPED